MLFVNLDESHTEIRSTTWSTLGTDAASVQITEHFLFLFLYIYVAYICSFFTYSMPSYLFYFYFIWFNWKETPDLHILPSCSHRKTRRFFATYLQTCAKSSSLSRLHYKTKPVRVKSFLKAFRELAKVNVLLCCFSMLKRNVFFS